MSVRLIAQNSTPTQRIFVKFHVGGGDFIKFYRHIPICVKIGKKGNALLKALRVIMIKSRRLRELAVSSNGQDMALGYIKSMINCQSVSMVRRNL
jgi:hypothetical protein